MGSVFHSRGQDVIPCDLLAESYLLFFDTVSMHKNWVPFLPPKFSGVCFENITEKRKKWKYAIIIIMIETFVVHHF